MRLIPIHPENLKLAWKDVKHYIEAGLDFVEGKYHIEDVRNMVESQELILWVVYNDESKRAIGCLLTQAQEYPRNRVLNIFLLAGEDISAILTCLPELKEYAQGLRCSNIEFYGRKGWSKVLKDHQFTEIHTVMSLKL